MSARWGMPNACEPCGTYHARDYAGCVRRKTYAERLGLPPAAPAVRENIDPPEPVVSDPRYAVAWQQGYAAAMADIAERRPVE